MQMVMESVNSQQVLFGAAAVCFLVRVHCSDQYGIGEFSAGVVRGGGGVFSCEGTLFGSNFP